MVSNTLQFLAAQVPEGLETADICVEVKVGEEWKESNRLNFVYEKPIIKGFDRNHGIPEEIVTIKGENFGTLTFSHPSVSWVKFGKSFAEIVSWDDNEIRVKAPADYGTGDDDFWTALTITHWLKRVSFLPTLPSIIIDLLWPSRIDIADTNIEVDVTVSTFVGVSDSAPWTYKYPETPVESIDVQCPVELRIYDSQGRVTGTIFSKEKSEIPYSHCFGNAVIIFCANESYQYEVVGQDGGNYNLTAVFVTNQSNVTFAAINIPTTSNETHRYSVDWTALSQGEEGVTVDVDLDGNGVPEYAFTSDSELTQIEYIIATDDTPPQTWLSIGEPEFVVNDITYLTSVTPIELIAEDDLGGSGVASTAYRIQNASYDSGWKTYTHPFLLIGLSDGVYHIDYNSTDYAGNVELTHTIQVTLFSWNYIFEDTYGRGTTLKINLAHRFFQFITPDKDYGIRNATYMRQSGRAITIAHSDKQLQLITTAVDTKLDFCIAVAWDLQTRRQYFLIDKLGIEK
jgi:hypothetical protein